MQTNLQALEISWQSELFKDERGGRRTHGARTLFNNQNPHRKQTPKKILAVNSSSVRHRGIREKFPFCVWKCPESARSRIKGIFWINKRHCHTLPFLTSVRLNRRSCSAAYPDSSLTAGLTRIWLTLEIECDSNWLNITYVFRIKRNSSWWEFIKFERRRHGHPFSSQKPWSRSALEVGGGWGRVSDREAVGSTALLTAGWSRSWRTGGRTCRPIRSYQGAWSMDGPESSSLKSCWSRGFALGSGSLRE